MLISDRIKTYSKLISKAQCIKVQSFILYSKYAF